MVTGEVWPWLCSQVNTFNIGYSDNGLFGVYAISEGKNMDPVRDLCVSVHQCVCVFTVNVVLPFSC